MQHIQKKHAKLAVVLAVAGLLIALSTAITLWWSMTRSGSVITNQVALPKNYTVEYPRIHDEELDVIIQSYISEEIAGFVKKAGSDTDQRSRMVITYQSAHLGQKTASFLFTKKVKYPDQPERETIRAVTLDYIAKKRLALKDIVKDDGKSREVLAWLLYDFFKHTPNAELLSPAQLTALYDFTINDIRDIWLDVESLVIVISPQDLKNKDAETKRIAIKKELIASALYEAYVPIDPNREGVPEIPVSFRIATQPPAGNAINPNEKMLALTFDDGPVGLTSGLLDTLRRYGGRATFFVLGGKVGGYAGVINRAIQEGHEIGNHSWSHADLRNLSADGLEHEIGGTQRILQEMAAGYTPRFMRPPYGNTNDTVRSVIHKYGMIEAMWTIDTRDWRDRDPQLIYDRIIHGAYDGADILLHDVHPASVEAANRAIPVLRSQGYQLVTLSELYRYKR